MNNRRDLLKTTALAASLAAFGSVRRSFAAGKPKYTNIIFTKDDPGRWKGKESIHVPQVTITGSKVVVDVSGALHRQAHAASRRRHICGRENLHSHRQTRVHL